MGSGNPAASLIGSAAPHLTFDELPRSRGVLPEGLPTMVPGSDLGSVLAQIDHSQLNGYEVSVVVEALARQVSHYQALLYAEIAELGRCPMGFIDSPPVRDVADMEFWPDEIALTLTLTRRAAELACDLAGALVGHPQVWRALADGRIDLARAKVMCTAVEQLDSDTANSILDAVLEEAEGLTTGQLKNRLRKLLFEHDPEAAEKRYRKGVKERRVEKGSNPDGTANLFGMSLPADRAAAISDKLDQLARQQSDDGRTMDQRRADIFMDLLEGKGQTRHGSDRAGTVDLRVPLSTLIGLSEEAGEIAGFGPVVADIARQIALRQVDGQWRVTLTDPDTGAVLWNGTTRRRPTGAQRRRVEAENPTCVFPGCRVPAMRSDIDHTRARCDGGSTRIRNLAPLCRHHHRLKHTYGWEVTHRGDGTYQWKTPHGRTYVSVPIRC